MGKSEIVFALVLLLLAAAMQSADLEHLENMTIYSDEKIMKFKVKCGNMVCEPGENEYNCAEDCAISPISYRTNLVNPRLSAGQEKQYYVDLTNNFDQKDIIVRLGIEGMIKDFVRLDNLSVYLLPGDTKRVPVTLDVDDLEKIDSYSGGVTFSSTGRSVTMPVTVNVVNVRDTLIELDINVIGEMYSPERPIRVQHNIYSYESQPVDLQLRYRIVNSDVDRSIASFVANRTVRGSDIFIDSFNISSEQILEGNYFIEVDTEYDGSLISASDSFVISLPFWSPFRIRLAIMVVLVVLGAIISLAGYQWYKSWRKDKMRYLLPDFRKLPRKSEDNLWVGKIPESPKKAYFDPNDLTTHVLIAGSTGSGKSVSASILAEAALLKNIPVVVFDPTSQWTGFVKQCVDKKVLHKYMEFGFREEDAHPFKGLIMNVDKPEVNINFNKYMNPGEITVFNLSSLKPGDYDVAVKNIVDTVFGIEWEESSKLKLLLVFDEVHRLLEKYGGKGGYVSLEKACREFRKWGIGLIMVSQVSTDFKDAVAGNILTEVQLNTKSMEDIQKVSQKYGLDYSTKVTRQGIGVAMVQNPKYNRGKPWFINFRPPLHNPHKINDFELTMYTDYALKLDEFDKIVEKAKARGADVGDLRLELKLTRDKLKEGHFKMVDIYINSLKESIKKL